MACRADERSPTGGESPASGPPATLAAMKPPRRRVYPFAGMRLPLVALGRMTRDPEGRGLLLLVISLFLVGTVFYTVAQGWSVIDALYFSTTTLATVGFGDFVPTHWYSKLFTVLYILGGVGILVAFFTELTRRTVELGGERRGRRPNQAP
jgi:voltage-gated potassium channel